MLTEYLLAAMRGAKYELMEDGGHYASIPGFDGVWADAGSLEECRRMGFEGPYAGGKHQIMQKGTQTIRIPNPHRADIWRRTFGQDSS